MISSGEWLTLEKDVLAAVSGCSVLSRSVRPSWSRMFKSSLSLLVFCLIAPDIIESRDILVKVIQRTQINGIKKRFLKLGIVLCDSVSPFQERQEKFTPIREILGNLKYPAETFLYILNREIFLSPKL